MDRENNSPKMGLTVEVDGKSGFCYGVIKAIKQAETILESSGEIFSLGAIVHNNTELSRLAKLGMKVINHKEIEKLKDSVLFIRAHGEPPSTYSLARERRLQVLDCTCPVVLKLQERIRRGYAQVKEIDGTLLIYGKRGHAEVNGLVGQVNGDAIVIESINDLGSVDFRKPVTIFSQTTMDPVEYAALISLIKKMIIEGGGQLEKFTSHNTICRQVSSRHPHLKQFAQKHSVIIFVSGSESSNGKVLFETCRSVNERAYKIENSGDIRREWFSPGENVGVCGATSTPMWQLEEIANIIRDL
jgi:4-hydroxy-3-methylbut-2-en-1-yl diphosphate reductase